MDNTMREQLQALSLREKEDCIKELRRMIDEELAKLITMRGNDFDLMFKIYCAAAAEVFSLADILARKRNPRYVAARSFVMKTMRDNGASTLWIADRMGMSHATVIYLTQKLEYDLASGGGEQEFDIVELWETYKKRILI